jgi:hypothetical protein
MILADVKLLKTDFYSVWEITGSPSDKAYALDVIGELAFGYLSSGHDVGGQIENMRGRLRKRFAVSMVPWFFPISCFRDFFSTN